MEVDKYYKYSEERVDSSTVAFGWRIADSLPEQEDYILAYHSRSKFASEEETTDSRREGSSAATVSDYTTFFDKVSGVSPDSFYQRWEGKEEELKRYWNSNFPEADEKQHLFMLKLARLIVTGKKFVMYSRGFKLVKADGLLEEDQRGNSASEV